MIPEDSMKVNDKITEIRFSWQQTNKYQKKNMIHKKKIQSYNKKRKNSLSFIPLGRSVNRLNWIEFKNDDASNKKQIPVSCKWKKQPYNFGLTIDKNYSVFFKKTMICLVTRLVIMKSITVLLFISCW